MSEVFAYLADPPRWRGRVLDVRGRSEGLPAEWEWWQGRTVLRLFTLDPYEAEREGSDRFIANHVLEEPEVVLYLSWGEAELEAADIGWDDYLARAWATAIGAAVDHAEACRRGMYTAERIALRRTDAAAEWREPLEVAIEWRTAGWAGYSLGVMVDIVEAEYGLIGYAPEPLELSDVEVPDAECPACNARPVFVPHSPGSVTGALCGEHRREWDERSADRIPGHSGEAKRALAAMMLSATQPQAPAGFWAGLARVDPESGPSQYAFLQRVADWCRLEDADLDDVSFVDDAMTDAMPFSLGSIVRDLGVDAAVEAAEFQRTLQPSQCWGPDVDLVGIFQESGRRHELKELREHLATHGRDQPFAYHMLGESYEEQGDLDEAEKWFRKAMARSATLRHAADVDLALKALRRVLGRQGGRVTELQQLDELVASIEARGIGFLRRARNDACLCGSGVKSKRCCG